MPLGPTREGGAERLSHEQNQVTNNQLAGIASVFVGGRGTHDDTIDANVVRRNGRDGIHVTEGAVGNRLTGNVGSDNGVLTLAGFDGYDGNLDGATNVWRANDFAKANQPCVTAS